MKKKGLIITVIMLIITGCSVYENNNTLQNTGVLTININNGSRTILPKDFSSSIKEYKVYYTGPESIEKSVITSTSAVTLKDLTPGNWSLLVEALDSSSNVIAKGETKEKIVVEKDQNSATSITIKPVQNNSGTLNLVIDWNNVSLPSGIINNIVATLINREDQTLVPINIIKSENKITVKETLSSGFYNLSIHLKSNDLLYVSILEIVQIFDFQESSDTIDLTSKDISSPPPAPQNLAFSQTNSNTIKVSWDDVARTETSYDIYVSENNGTFKELKIDMPANTDSYTHENLSLGTNYSYKIVAKNSFGISDELNGVSLNKNITVKDIVDPIPGGEGLVSVNNIENDKVTINWLEASDDITTNTSNLTYDIYYSKSDKMDTIDEIKANGTLATSHNGIKTITINNLETFEEYYINIIVKDSVGNESCYKKITVKTKSEGSIGLSIQIDSPTEAAITFNESDYVEVNIGESITISINESPKTTQWYLNNNNISSNTNSIKITPAIQNLDPGVHKLQLLYVSNGLWYSKSFTFNVVN